MDSKKLGQQTLNFANPLILKSWASIVGPKEGEGPLAEYFDMILENNLDNGDKSWENTEQKLMQHSMELALEKANLKASDLEFYLAGDLLNQIINANFTARFLGVPFLGIYGACSTLAEGMSLASMILDGGFAKIVGFSASSHHDTAERQLRFPTEMGSQRPMTAQWTVTGAGSYILERGTNGSSGTANAGIRVTQATVGKIVDRGVSNNNDLGSAMAPAAFDTIITNLQDTGRKIDDYDLIITGDLGSLGLNILKELLRESGYPVKNVSDCGILIYKAEQDTHCGGSGCGCSAVVLNYLLQKMLDGEYRRIFFIGTGALLSPSSIFQGETIPSIAHGVVLEYNL
ncbi:MAG: stage V sporulation protein AD [Peptococcia bacterium]